MKKDLIAHIVGGQVPNGKVRISGAKNASTRLLSAALIADDKVTLDNFPTELVDARYKMDFIEKCGGVVEINEVEQTVSVNPVEYTDRLLESYNYPIRTTYLLVAGLIKRSGIARIPYPGGCKIGDRGYDMHIMVWEKLGATVEEKPDFIEVKAPNGFQTGEIDFPISTVGGTENALICAATVNGETIIKNAYVSPEVQSLVDFLRVLGAKIDVLGNSLIKVYGSKHLRGTVFSVMPDRIEAITWIIYGIISGGNITIEDVPFDVMQIPLIHLQDAGIDLYRSGKNVIATPECLSSGAIQPFELACGTHPGIISDMQPFYVMLGLHANGTSRVFDYRYPERLKYCEELSKFYQNSISWKTGAITTYGNKSIQGAVAQSTDLRGSMALVMAALLAKGESTILNVEMALRGYNNLHGKLKDLGINIDISESK